MSLITTLLESVCVIQRPTIGRDASSGVTQDPFVTIASNLPCSQQEASAGVRQLYAQNNTEVSTTLYFASDPGCETNDRAIVTDRIGNPTYYLLQGEAQIAAGRGRLWSVPATRVRAPS